MLLQTFPWQPSKLGDSARPEPRKGPPRITLDIQYMDTEINPTEYPRFSWLPQNPSNPIPPEVLTLRRCSSHSASPSKKQSPTTLIAHCSSTPPLYSHNSEGQPISSDQHSLFVAQPPRPTIETRVFPPLHSMHTPRKPTLWRPFPSIEPPRKKSPEYTTASFQKATSRTLRSTSDFMSLIEDVETVETSTLDGVKTPTQNDFIPASSSESRRKLSFEDVERLIFETDEAFRAVGTALQDAKTSTHGWHLRKASRAPRYSQDFGIGNMIKFTHGVSTAVATSSQSRPLQLAPRKNKSLINQTKKEETTAKQPPSKSSRLRLREVTANVSDLLSGKVFRTEADELPNRRLPLRILENTRRKSCDSTTSRDTEGATPTDPFHLEGLSSRIKAAQRMLSLPIYPPLTKLDLNSNSGYQTKAMPKLPFSSILNDDNMRYSNHTFPSPPRINLECESVPNDSDRPWTPSLRLSTGKDGKYMSLKSTPFTMLSPCYRHGPIKIERAAKEQTILSPIEEALDWTAFQMAILGTMDPDGGDQRDDWEWEADERELDGIMEWWEGFGLGIGGLERPPPEKKSVALKPPVLSRLQDDDKEVHSPPSYKEIERETASSSERSSPSNFKQGGAGARKGISNAKNRSSVAESLPPSPMLDLLAWTPSSEDEDVRIPMGFNLGHDLGDFLRWEAKHVQNLMGCQK